MYLPKKYKNFSSDYPEIVKAYKEMGTLVRESGPLDEKTQNLVKLGIAVGTNSRGGVMSHLIDFISEHKALKLLNI